MDIYNQLILEILSEVTKVIKGKENTILKALTAILAGGHILLEDVPGVGKTSLAIAFSRVMELTERRIQFTPDVLPSDVVGFYMMNHKGEFDYKPGVVWCNLLLADEINRTSSKTQSALLEVMEEGNVTVDGITRALDKPFIVIATQNPIGSVGTQNLPESQLDRFMVRLSMGYPDVQEEINMLRERQGENPIDGIHRVISKQQLLEIQEQVESVFVHDRIIEYVVELVNATRNHAMISLGVSPRGSLALIEMAKATAYICNRDYCLPEDVKNVFECVCAHRIILSANARINHMKETAVLSEILHKITMPRLRKKQTE